MAKELIRISGSVETVVYTNEDNGYTVLRLNLDDGGSVTVVGTLPYTSPGEKLIIEGEWTTHQYHGDQFKAENFERLMPASVTEIYTYLASGVIKGIGPSTARTITDHFGEDTLRMLEEEPELLVEIKGISRKRAEEIGAAYKRQSSLRRLMELFAVNKIHLQYAMRLYGSYGDEALAAVTSNPYIITDEYFGADFTDADRLALHLGFTADSPERIEAAVTFELSYNANNGHCFIPQAKLINAVSQLISVPEADAAMALNTLLESGEVIMEEIAGQKACYLTKLYAAEIYVAARLAAMTDRSFYASFEPDALIELAEKEMGIKLAEKQRQAVRASACHGIFALTGGPGTGKTTTVRAILRLFDKMGLKTALAAPTGRAAKRMSELCHRDASTIHRLLETGFDPDLSTLVFKKDADDPLDADAVILDEASMVDITLMQALLCAMRKECRLILVGDADQLPSVGPGNLFEDLIKSDIIPCVKLTEIFRQAAESRIIKSAHLINEGAMPDLKTNTGDFFFLNRKNGEAAVDTILELCSERLPKKMGIPPEEIQVLSPTRRYNTGTFNLNKKLQDKLNPPAADKPEKLFGDFIFRKGDRVMQIRNNYDIMWTRSDGVIGTGVFNGDIGSISEIDAAQQIMTVIFEDKSVDYAFDMLGELEPAYAMTVHKSQGSEYRAVILSLVKSAPTLLSRAVLYTAVTRARELLIIVGDEEAVAQMVNNNRTRKRYSGLKSRLLCAADLYRK
jgi:exodeoxyribonuclease V alpha subunit